jgi:hypothetical protein
MDALVAEAEKLRFSLPEKEQEAQDLIESMKQTRDKMRWVMTQKKRQGGN